MMIDLLERLFSVQALQGSTDAGREPASSIYGMMATTAWTMT